ncbi:hypothetical protein, partial [Helicobacter sp. 12S02232-10]|uniref:hypothetical protein n=1 Tax=Helicobacter sp. 12S02232-10 TaxID=1476197 RepID=UPI0015DF36B1
MTNTQPSIAQLSLQDTTDTTPDKVVLKQMIKAGGWTNAARSSTITALNAIVSSSFDLRFQNGSTMTFNFTNSVYQGNFINGYQPNGAYGTSKTSTFTFDGSYQGNSDASLKGYAWVGNINIQAQDNQITFKNDANMKGNITASHNSGSQSKTSLITFKDSALEGDITALSSAVDLKLGGAHSNVLSIVFDGNSTTKGYALKGADGEQNATIRAVSGGLNITFDNGAIAYANTNLSYDQYSQTDIPTLNITLKNKSVLNGNINNVKANFNKNPTQNVTLESGSLLKGNANNQLGILNLKSDNAKMIGNVNTLQAPIDSDTHTIITFTNSSLEGNIENNFIGKDHNGTYTNATFDGNNTTDGYALKGDVTNPYGTMNLTFKNGAVWQGDYKTNDATTYDQNSTKNNLTFDKGSITGSITLFGGTGEIKASNHSSLGNISTQAGRNGVITKLSITASDHSSLGNISGDALLTASFSDSSVGDIQNSNANSTLTFATASDTAPTDKTGEVSSEDKKITIGDITNFRGTITG